jgi:hypothetical protein
MGLRDRGPMIGNILSHPDEQMPYHPPTHICKHAICVMCHFCSTVHDGHSVQTSSLQVYVSLMNHKKCPLSQNAGYKALSKHTIVFRL